MGSKGIRNVIIALLFLAIGSWFLLRVGKAFLPKDSPVDFSSIFSSFESLFTLFLIGIVIIIIILIPVWIAKKRQESKEAAIQQLKT